MFKKSLIAVAIFSALILSACGNSPEINTFCKEEGAGSKTKDGQEIMCTNRDGELVWLASGPGSEGQSGIISRPMWDFAANSCPEAIADTGYEMIIINNNELFTADPGTNDMITTQCEEAVKKGRTTNYSLSVDGVDYITQVEKAGAKIRTLNENFSKGKCEDRSISFSNSFTSSADNVEMIWPLGMVSNKHVIPTDHVYIQWKNMKPAANEVLAPADGYVVNVEGVQDDFRIILEMSCNEYMAFGHVDAFAGPIEDLVSNFADGGHHGIDVRVPVKAGDVLALGGEVMTDVWYWDQTKQIDGVRVANYLLHNGMNMYAVDPFAYLSDPVSKDLASKFVGESIKTHGKIGWNVQGTAQGSWYQLDTLGEHGPLASWLDHIDLYSKNLFGPWDGALSWAPDGLDPSTYLFAVGTFNENGSVIGITKENMSPMNLKVGGAPVALEIYDFDYVDADGKLFSRDDPAKRKFSSKLTATPNAEKLGVVVLQLVDENTLKVEKRPGGSADATPTFKGEAITYKR